MARAPAEYFLDICAGRGAPLSVAAIKAGLAVLVPFDAEAPLREAHDLTDPNVDDIWHGQVRLVSLQEYSHAATRAQRFWGISICGGRKIFCSTKTSLPFSLPSGPWAVTSCGCTHRSAQHFIGTLCKISCPTLLLFWLCVDACQIDMDAYETLLFAMSFQGLLPLASQSNSLPICARSLPNLLLLL